MAAPTRMEPRNGASKRGAAGRPSVERQGPRQRQGRTLAEWLSLAISLAIVLGLAGLVTYLHLTDADRPVALDVRLQLEDVRYDGEAYYLPVEITNRGDRTAEDVRVRLGQDGEPASARVAEIGVEFLAGGASHKGTVAFPDDPSRNPVRVAAISYSEP